MEKKEQPVPKFFKYAYMAGGLTKLSSALSVSINTLLVALGATPFQISTANSLKWLGKVLSQFFALHFLNGFASHRKALMVALSIELLGTLCFAIIAFTQPAYWFLLILALMFITGILGHTSFLAYYGWMGEIVPSKLKDVFFANRSITGEFAYVAGFFVASYVLELEMPILILLTGLYIAGYIVRNLEVLSYILHPDVIRRTLPKNNIIRRMRSALRDRSFMIFSGWYNLVNIAAILNILFLEFFIIHILELPFSWIPLSLIFIAIGGILGLSLFKYLFPKFHRKRKLLFMSVLVLLSSIIWLFVEHQAILVIALMLAGAIARGIHLTQRVEVINYAENKDEEAYYAAFNTIEYTLGAIATFTIGTLQASVFNFNLVFFVTIPLVCLSFLFVPWSNIMRYNG